MSKGGLSVFVFGVYLAIVGGLLVTVPNAFLGVAGFPPTTEPWVRVVGVLVLCIACYYTLAGRAGLRDFVRWTVAVRAFVMVAFAALVALRIAPAPLLAFGAVDLAGALWTALALRADDRAA